MTAEPEQPAGGPPLEQGTDYLYCPICDAHAPCRPTPNGGWETFHGPMPEGDADETEAAQPQKGQP